jgi:hypothetical protein
MVRMLRLDPNWQVAERNSLLRAPPSAQLHAQREDVTYQQRKTNKHINIVVDHTRLYPSDASSLTHLAALACSDASNSYNSIVCGLLVRRLESQRDFVSETHFFKSEQYE